jgi:nucleotide-binding universal stress UspA family protein
MKLEVLLVPIDFSSLAHHALLYAIDLARGSGATIHLLHACYIDPQMAPDAIEPFAELRARVRDSAARRLEKAEHPVREAGLACESHLVELRPVDGILELASQIGADLIVMGTRGTSGLERLLLGSVAERTVRSAPCPVLTLGRGVAEHES